MLLVRRNIRAIGTNQLLFPLLLVERIQVITYKTQNGVQVAHEFLHLENGTRVRTHEVLFLEPVDEDLLIAMRLEARILDAAGK